MEIRFDQRIVVVTGGASGIGLATAELFAKSGAIVYNLDIQEAEKSIHNVFYKHCDITSYESIQLIIGEIVEAHGQIHHAFLNAGVHQVGTVESLSVETMESVIDVNLKGVIYSLKCLLPVMREHQMGSIVVMGSDQSFVGKGDSFIYGATKGAIGQLTKSTAIDYALFNVRINCICPGTIDTPLYHSAVENFSNEKGMDKNEVYELIEQAQPIQRVGTHGEIANTVVFLSADQSSFTTGKLVSVDGGYVAQ